MDGTPGTSTDILADELEDEKLESDRQRARGGANVEARTGRSPGQVAFDRLKDDKVAIFCFIIVILFILMAIFAPLLASLESDRPRHWVKARPPRVGERPAL